MRRLWIAAMVVAVGVSPAWAQPQRGQGTRGMGVLLLGQKSVQDELKLSDEQKDKIKEFSAKAIEKFQGLRDLSQEERQAKGREIAEEAQKFVKETLKPEQAKRLHQIGLQQAGLLAFADPEVAKGLNLTDEQKDKLKTIGEDARKEMQDLRQSGASREEMATKMREARQKNAEKAAGVLTSEQKDKWKEMTGEPFKGEIRFGFGGGQGGGRRGQRNSEKK